MPFLLPPPIFLLEVVSIIFAVSPHCQLAFLKVLSVYICDFCVAANTHHLLNPTQSRLFGAVYTRWVSFLWYGLKQDLSEALADQLQIFVTCLLVAFARTAPLEKRDETSVVQGLLGTDGFWNDFDGQNTYDSNHTHS